MFSKLLIFIYFSSPTRYNVRMKNIFYALVGIGFFAFTHTAFASVSISEVAYDIYTEAGGASDSGREWVEVYNSSGADIDISFWKLREEGVNHKLEVVKGTGVVLAGGYAVIADNTDKFLIDYPSYTGVLFDSSFSLKNTGEELVLKDAVLVDIDTLTYDPTIGAGGDGNSLQKRAGVWTAEVPTPGLAPAVAPVTPTPTTEGSGASSSSTTPPPPTSTSYWPAEPQILVSAGPRSRVVVAGADTVFEGKSLGLSGKPLVNETYMWAFGDGGWSEQKKVLYAYTYPGDYIAVLNVSSGEYTAADYVTVKVIPADLVISRVGGDSAGSFIEVQNDTAYRLDLSWWGLRAGDKTFTIPKDTFITAGGSIMFPSVRTGLSSVGVSPIQLLYPNGFPLVPQQSVPVTPETPPERFVAPATVDTRQSTPVDERVFALPPEHVVAPPLESIATTTSPTTTIGQSASVGFAVGETQQDSSVWMWLLAVLGISLLSAVAVIIKRKEETEKKGMGFSIIEEE